LKPNLDDIISRHLDGELTPAEQAWLFAAISESPELAAQVHDAVLTARAARRTPALHQPLPQVTNTLFQRLAAEGLNRGLPVSVPPISASPQRRRIFYPRLSIRTATLAVVFGLFAAIVVGDGVFNRTFNGAFNAPLTNRAGREAMAAAAIPPVAISNSQLVDSPVPLTSANVRTDAKPEKDAVWEAIPTASEQPTVAQQIQPEVDRGNDGDGEYLTSDLPSPTPTLATAVSQQGMKPSSEVESKPPQQSPASQVSQEREQEQGGGISVAASSGVSYVLKGAGITRQETAINVAIAFNNNHSISVVGGYSPGLRKVDDALAMASEFQSTSTTSSTDNTESVNTGGLQRDSKAATQRAAESSEPWIGVGYNYSMALYRDIAVAPGVVAGAAATSWRVGAELPVRYCLARTVSLELVAAASYVRPYPEQGGGFDFTDDANRYHYYGTPDQAAFTAVGVRLGVVVKMRGSN